MDYKEILEGVVKIINTTESSDIGFANICDHIGENCPELKESEDKRVRKELITHFRNARCVTEEGAERIAKWITWLEKQGEQEEPTDKVKPFDEYEGLTTDQAREIAVIAREETIKKVCEWLDDELCCYIKAQDFTIDHKRLNKDLRKHLEDEDNQDTSN